MIINGEVIRTAIADILAITRENKLFTTQDIKKNLGKTLDGYNGALILGKKLSKSRKGSLGLEYKMEKEMPIRIVINNHDKNFSEIWVKSTETFEEYKLRVGESIRHNDGSYVIHYTQYKTIGSADFSLCIRNLRRLEGQIYRETQKHKRAYRLKNKKPKYVSDNA